MRKVLNGTRFRPFFRCTVCILFMLLSGCSRIPLVGEPPVDPGQKELEHRLRQAVDLWEGTPYRFGGTGRTGVDCSGFVMILYKHVFDIQLPRTTEQQIHAGKPIHFRQLQAGDLLFFEQPKKKLHIGIYVGDGQFAHASSSKGVTISNIKDPYWQKTLWIARRVLSL